MAQISSGTPNSVFNAPPAPSNYQFQAFEMPISTDMKITYGLPMQVTVSSTPAPLLHYNFNGTNNSREIPTDLFANRKIFVDDICLVHDGTNTFAFIVCRISAANNITDIYLFRARWNGVQYNIPTTPILLDTRQELPTPDNFDRVSIASSVAEPENIGIAYSKNGNIIYKDGLVNFITGSVSFTSFSAEILTGNSTAYPGRFSNPDICKGEAGHFGVSTIYQHENVKSVYAHTSDHDSWYNSLAYSTSDVNKRLRTPRIDMTTKYEYAVCINEIDDLAKKSSVILVARDADVNYLPSATIVVNSDLEASCTNNDNYRYTGFPVVKYSSLANQCEVVWQQVMCEGSNICSINALSKRFSITSPGNLSVITPLFGNQYFFINSDLSRNSVFPSIATLFENCINFYSFGIMDAGTSANGQVVYKQSTCDGTSLRPGAAMHQSNYKATAKLDEKSNVLVTLFPNPANTEVYLKTKGLKGTSRYNLYSQEGKQVGGGSHAGNNLLKINLHGLPPGSYLLRLLDEAGNSSQQRLVIQR